MHSNLKWKSHLETQSWCFFQANGLPLGETWFLKMAFVLHRPASRRVWAPSWGILLKARLWDRQAGPAVWGRAWWDRICSAESSPPQHLEVSLKTGSTWHLPHSCEEDARLRRARRRRPGEPQTGDGCLQLTPSARPGGRISSAESLVSGDSTWDGNRALHVSASGRLAQQELVSLTFCSSVLVPSFLPPPVVLPFGRGAHPQVAWWAGRPGRPRPLVFVLCSSPHCTPGWV